MTGIMDVWVAVIGGVASVFTAAATIFGAILWRKINRVGDDAAATRTQTENTHTTNLRDDLDTKFADVTDVIHRFHHDDVEAINLLRAEVGQVRTDLRGVHRDIADIHQADTEAQTEHRSLWQAIKALSPIGGD